MTSRAATSKAGAATSKAGASTSPQWGEAQLNDLSRPGNQLREGVRGLNDDYTLWWSFQVALRYLLKIGSDLLVRAVAMAPGQEKQTAILAAVSDHDGNGYRNAKRRKAPNVSRDSLRQFEGRAKVQLEKFADATLGPSLPYEVTWCEEKGLGFKAKEDFVIDVEELERMGLEGVLGVLSREEFEKAQENGHPSLIENGCGEGRVVYGPLSLLNDGGSESTFEFGDYKKMSEPERKKSKGMPSTQRKHVAICYRARVERVEKGAPLTIKYGSDYWKTSKETEPSEDSDSDYTA